MTNKLINKLDKLQKTHLAAESKKIKMRLKFFDDIVAEIRRGIELGAEIPNLKMIKAI